MAGAPGEAYKQPRFGGFQEPRFLGGAYVNPDGPDPAATAANKTKKAKRDAELAKRASGNPFKPPSVVRVGKGKGDYSATLTKPIPNMGTGTDEKIKKGDVQCELPNMKYAPAKKGSYGQPGTTLSERKGAAGVAGEYGYVSDPYDAARVAANEARAKDIAAKVTEKPFRPTSYMKKGGGTVCPGVVFEKIPFMPCPPAEVVRKGAEESKPFVPSSYPKKGHNRTLEKFPKYEADPLDLKIAAQRKKREAEAERMASGKPFVPGNYPRTSATVSIIRRNL